MNSHVLLSGQKIPHIGFGTWELAEDSVVESAVKDALKSGYRLIDTAKVYENEVGVGKAIRESHIPRSEIFVTTKLWNYDQGYEQTLRAVELSLQKLGLDYLDLYLIHWPATTRRNDSWRAMIELQRRGMVRAIGVSNYTVRHLRELMDQSGIPPAVNQIEFHPLIYDEQKEVADFCNRHGIVIEAYSPLSRMLQSGLSSCQKIAEKHGVSDSQVALKWCVQHGTVPLPRSSNKEHIKENINIDSFELDHEDMSALNSISTGERVTWDPATMR